MKIAIIGAGAMGCLYACFLSGENEVTLLDASDAVVSAIGAAGVFLQESDGTENCYTVRAEKSGESVDTFDLVILFVKDTVSRAALASNAGIIGENTVLLSLQNGLGNYEILREFVPGERILLGTSKHNSVVLAPGRVYHSGVGETQIGSPAGNTALAQRVAKNFGECGIDCRFCENVNHLLWKKLFVNLTVNPITAILGSTIGVLADVEECRALAESVIDEALAVARADGETFSEKETKEEVLLVCEKLRTGKASMCQDILNCRKTEIDFINGAVVRLGEKYGIPTPVNRTVTQLIKTKEKMYEEIKK